MIETFSLSLDVRRISTVEEVRQAIEDGYTVYATAENSGKVVCRCEISESGDIVLIDDENPCEDPLGDGSNVCDIISRRAACFPPYEDSDCYAVKKSYVVYGEGFNTSSMAKRIRRLMAMA